MSTVLAIVVVWVALSFSLVAAWVAACVIVRRRRS